MSGDDPKQTSSVLIREAELTLLGLLAKRCEKSGCGLGYLSVDYRGDSRTWPPCLVISAFGGKADMTRT
jgi:hypothetical protein